MCFLNAVLCLYLKFLLFLPLFTQVGPLLDWVASLRICIGYPDALLVERARYLDRKKQLLPPETRKFFDYIVGQFTLALCERRAVDTSKVTSPIFATSAVSCKNLSSSSGLKSLDEAWKMFETGQIKELHRKATILNDNVCEHSLKM